MVIIDRLGKSTVIKFVLDGFGSPFGKWAMSLQSNIAMIYVAFLCRIMIPWDQVTFLCKVRSQFYTLFLILILMLIGSNRNSDYIALYFIRCSWHASVKTVWLPVNGVPWLHRFLLSYNDSEHHLSPFTCVFVLGGDELTHFPLVPRICVSESGQHWFI